MKIYNYFKDMAKENISQEFRLKNKKVCTTLNYIEHFLTLALTITGCISISAFTYLVGISIGITSSAIGLKRFVITEEIRKYVSQ